MSGVKGIESFILCGSIGYRVLVSAHTKSSFFSRDYYKAVNAALLHSKFWIQIYQ